MCASDLSLFIWSLAVSSVVVDFTLYRGLLLFYAGQILTPQGTAGNTTRQAVPQSVTFIFLLIKAFAIPSVGIWFLSYLTPWKPRTRNFSVPKPSVCVWGGATIPCKH